MQPDPNDPTVGLAAGFAARIPTTQREAWIIGGGAGGVRDQMLRESHGWLVSHSGGTGSMSILQAPAIALPCVCVQIFIDW